MLSVFLEFKWWASVGLWYSLLSLWTVLRGRVSLGSVEKFVAEGMSLLVV